MFGCLLAGFYLLRVYDMADRDVRGGRHQFVVAVAFAALAVGPRKIDRPEVSRSRDRTDERCRGRKRSRAVLIAIALSGMCALGAEVIWTRLLSLMLGATVYTFSIILAVFLVGLGIGSAAGSTLVAVPRR